MYQKQLLNSFFLWVNKKRNSKSWMAKIISMVEKILNIPALKDFITNLGKVFIYNRTASFFIMLIGIITARALGPTDFGVIGLVGNASNFLIIPIIMGVNNVMFKYLPGSNPLRVKKLISTAFLGNMVTMTLFGGIFFFGYNWIGAPLRISRFVWYLSLSFTIIMNLFSLTESFLRGQEKYSLICRIRLISSIIFFLLILSIFYGLNALSLETYFFSFFLSQLVFVLVSLYTNRRNLRGFSFTVAKEIYQYGAIMMLHMLANAIIFSSDLFILNYFSPGKDVGIYTVYQGTVKNLFVVLFYEVFAVVFLPTIAQMDRVSVYYKIKKLILPILTLITVATMGLISVTILLFGKEYPLNFWYTLLVSLSIGFYVLFQIYNCLFTMEGNKGALVCLIPFAIVLPIYLINQVFLTKIWGITGAMVSVLITNILLFTILGFLIKRLLKKIKI